jgi:DNA-binding NtrC family response regulator
MGTRILIADDDADMRDLLQEVLEDAGYDTLVAVDGRVALAQVEVGREMLDLVITDVRMPGVTGDQLLRVVRERRAEAPVIVITAFGSVEQAVEMVKAGAFQYLTKPFDPPDLLRAVEQALEVSARNANRPACAANRLQRQPASSARRAPCTDSSI